MPEAAEDAARAVPVPDVGTVRIALLIGVRVVLAVVCHPAHDRSLHGHRAEDREGVLEWLRRLKGSMGKQPVEADGHAEAGDHVHDAQDREVGRRHGAVPQQHDRGEERGEGQRHGGEVDSLLKSGHDSSIPASSRYQ
jgi:hypothetical protein